MAQTFDKEMFTETWKGFH